MTEAHICSRCGARLPGEGDCPRCLLHLGIDLVPRDPDAAERVEGAPPGTGSGPRAASASHGAASGPRRHPARREPEPVEVIAKRFPTLEILEVLGRGGMGVVYKARQKKLDRFVALKVLAPELSADPDFAERFLREARALARLAHPNIVAVHDFGEEAGSCWLLMEYVDGANLRALLQTGELTPERALGLVAPMCDALQCAHDLGIVHRDVKPENVLVDARGVVKIVDFGLAKLAGERGEVHLTRTEQVMGTPQYMAPEQMRASHDVDHRADIYSLGVVLYELLTGTLPVGNYALPSRRVAVDVRIDDVVLRAMEHEPARRYQHVVEVKTDVEAARTPAASTSGPPADIDAEDEVDGSDESDADGEEEGPREIFARIEARGSGFLIDREFRTTIAGDRLTALLGVVVLVLGSVAAAIAAVATTSYGRNLEERNTWYAVAGACLAGAVLFGAAVRRRYRAAHGAMPEVDDLDHREIDGALLVSAGLALATLLAAGFGTQDRFPTEVLWAAGSLLGLLCAGFALLRWRARLLHGRDEGDEPEETDEGEDGAPADRTRIWGLVLGGRTLIVLVTAGVALQSPQIAGVLWPEGVGGIVRLLVLPWFLWTLGMGAFLHAEPALSAAAKRRTMGRRVADHVAGAVLAALAVGAFAFFVEGCWELAQPSYRSPAASVEEVFRWDVATVEAEYERTYGPASFEGIAVSTPYGRSEFHGENPDRGAWDAFVDSARTLHPVVHALIALALLALAGRVHVAMPDARARRAGWHAVTSAALLPIGIFATFVAATFLLDPSSSGADAAGSAPLERRRSVDAGAQATFAAVCSALERAGYVAPRIEAADARQVADGKHKLHHVRLLAEPRSFLDRWTVGEDGAVRALPLLVVRIVTPAGDVNSDVIVDAGTPIPGEPRAEQWGRFLDERILAPLARADEAPKDG